MAMTTDIEAYDASEARAVADGADPVGSSSDAFPVSGFPMRIETPAGIRQMIGSLHDGASMRLAVQKELRGLRGEDVSAVARAADAVVAMQRTWFPGERALVPAGALLYEHLLARKVFGLPDHARVLDIGPGCGFLSLYFSAHAGIERHAQIEVTQSLYLLQAMVNRFAYGDAAVDLALAPDAEAPVAARSVHYPWWRIDAAFADSYDLIMMNENMCEMPGVAFERYLAGARRSLRREGYLLIQGIGYALAPQILDERLDSLRKFGFRAVVANQAQKHGGPLAVANLLLVTEGHPRHATANQDYFQLAFDERDPLVRSMFGLDRPMVPLLDDDALKRAIAIRLGTVPATAPAGG